MASSPTEKLYTPRLLALAAALADFPLRDDFMAYAERRSETCGSTIKLGISTDDVSQFGGIGMQVTACAVGQASAAILASYFRGKTLNQFDDAFEQVEAWVAGSGDLPDWPTIELLTPVLEHRGRHGAILLPWRAVRDALSSPIAKS